MKEISYLDAMAITTEKMSNGGVFLSVGKDAPNVMTIGWGAIGYYWRVPVFTVVVRPSRHSYGMLKEQKCFTASVPLDDSMKKELIFAGTKSGRNANKFKGHNLSAAPALTVSAPIVGECQLHFECVVKLVQDMTTSQMDEGVRMLGYPDGDLHTLFFGEIVRCYRTDLD